METISIRLRKGETILGDTLLLSTTAIKGERVAKAFRYCYGFESRADDGGTWRVAAALPRAERCVFRVRKGAGRELPRAECVGRISPTSQAAGVASRLGYCRLAPQRQCGGEQPWSFSASGGPLHRPPSGEKQAGAETAQPKAGSVLVALRLP
ncbi:hypothetical protein NDU88_006014 [Pleurodeles waltl]|uniref:Uncharacterized protein n=1 Tax=Pleurodeles waltl TaxID=8319 RepID=A0AAV7TCE1_PLEWA|nr:hypothetical protein NDU88_006014 [Pleurodeles waltl]